MNIPNFLTIIRVFISPIFLLVYLEYEMFGIPFLALPYVLLSLLSISELSDIFDGYFARKYNQVTDLGKILDPMADSISRTSVFLTFTLGVVQLPMFLIFMFIYRDSVISTLRTICAFRGFALAARSSGKTKAVIQAVAAFIVVTLMIPYSLGHLSLTLFRQLSMSAVLLAALYTLLSGIDYLYANREYIKKLLSSSPKMKTNEEL